jgi:transposase
MNEPAANPTVPREEYDRVVGALEAENKLLNMKLKKLQAMLFGRQSERAVGDDSAQLQLDAILQEVARLEAEMAAAQSAGMVARRATVAAKPRRSLEGLIPDYLPREEVVHDIPEEDKVDLASGLPMKKIGEDRVEKLAWKPGECFVRVHVYPKYAAPANPSQGVVRAPAPDFAIPGGSYDETFLAMLVTEKLARHVPLYRIEEQLRMMNVEVGRQTLSRLYIACADVLAPLMPCLKDEILSRGILFTDDTPVDLQVKGTSKLKQGRMWVYVAGGDGPPLRYYEFTPDRSKKRPRDFLGDYRGFIHADAYKGYDDLFKQAGVTECACWMHIRRKFFDAEDAPPALRLLFPEDIRRLYRWERVASWFGRTTVLAVRQKHIAPLIDGMIQRAQGLRDGGSLLPSSRFATVVGYLLNLGDAVKTFLQDARLKPDNGESERAIRPLAIGRKNWLFAGCQKGGEATGTLLSLVQNCRAIGAAPYDYLADVLARIQGHPASRVAELLPHNWLKAKAAAAAA